MSKSFVSPGSKELEAALATLDARVPLGATDMKKALNAAAESFQGDSKNARAVVYLGDGRSAAKIVTSQDFDALSQKLASSHISVSGYIVGTRTDAQIFGALAGKTGGMLLEDSESLDGEKAGRQLSTAIAGTVLWPTSVKWPAEMTEVFPKQAPPLRLDRDSVVVGKYQGTGPFEVQYEVETASGPQKLVFTAAPEAASGDQNGYLATLVKWAENDSGVPLIGTQSLENAKMIAVNSTKGWQELAKQAISSGNVVGAEKLAEAALRQDPNNIDALNVKDAAAKMREKMLAGKSPKAKTFENQLAGPDTLPPAGGATELNLVGPSAPVDDPNAGAFLDDIQHRSTVITQQAQAEVRATIDDARRMVGGNPRQAMTNLRLLLEKVRQVPEINPDVRDQLVGQLQSALQETDRRQKEFDRIQLKQQELLAAQKEQQIITENQLGTQMKVKQLMNRFNSLMSEGRYNMAEMQAAAEAQKLMPDSPALEAAKLTARDNDYFSTAMRLREARQKGVVDALASVEKSHIPFNDLEPIIYPDADFWRRISDKDNPDSRVNKYNSMDLSKQNSAESDIQQALKEPTQLEFTETSLQDVIDYLKDLHKQKHPSFEIVLDTRALSDVGVTPETLVTKNLKGISLRSALRLLLKDLQATYMIKDEVLLITSQDVADQNMTTKVYPVADLVIPVQSQSMGGMMGGMGGGMMGGGMGGMGGGMMGGMGGGMGGMGGGMGGMGGGMGMGFNIPHELLPKIPQGGFQAFSVNDDLNVSAKQESKTSATVEKSVPVTEKKEMPASVAPAVAPKATASKFEKIEIDLKSGEKPEIVWDRYFAAHTPEPAAVRDAVRRLMYEAKYEHVIALIGSAIRHQQPQSWMYEAMSLAMQAAGRPQEDVERAIMSAVDFAQTSTDLMYIGTYLMTMDLNDRALDVFRQASALDPVQPQPYMLGLKVARKSNNIDGLRWASLGILSQAWPKEQTSVWQAGIGVADEVLAKLKAEGKTEEADAFLAELDKAVERDCAVVVNYTGDAQLDLVVREPTGSICNFRTPRTASGGMLLGNAIDQTNVDNGGGRSEIYVCPKGFDGNYQIAISRVFGNIATGKVHVKVMTHYRGKTPVIVEKTIPLVKDQALIAFDLKDGRRQEPIADFQIANAAVDQMKVNAGAQILAQQLEGSVNPGTMNSLAESNSMYGGGSGTGNGINGLPGFPFGRGGAVGYEPVIKQYPEGASMSVTAVVSADRRYVRISIPYYGLTFSGVGQVNTFNTSSGQGGTTSGGTGGQGYGGLNGGQTQGSNGTF
jgi:hypothetical protein